MTKIEKKLNILSVIETLSSKGGAEHALVNMVTALKRRGHHCEVGVLWGPYDLADSLESRGIRIHRLDLSHRWNIIQGTYRLSKLCKSRKFDIVHSHLFFAGIYNAISRLFESSSKRVVTFHNLAYESYPIDTLWKMVRKQIDSLLTGKFIDGHVAVSNASAMSYQRNLGIKEISVIPNAFPLESVVIQKDILRNNILNKYGVMDNDFVLVMPASLRHEKGHRYMLQALKILQGKSLFPKLLILGDGPLRGEIEKSVYDNNLERQVLMISTLPHDELFPIIQVSDAVVVSSTHEGFPMAPVEAMALYTPVIATRVGGLSDLIENEASGLLIPPFQPEALAEAIYRLKSEEGLTEKLRKGGRERIESHFSTEVVVELWEKYYSNLINSL